MRVSRRFAIVWLAAVLLGGLWSGAMARSAAGAVGRKPVLHLRFRVVSRLAGGNCGPSVMTSGDYALLSYTSGDCSPGFRVTDDRSHTSFSFGGGRGCVDALAFGMPWVLADCNDQLELFNIPTRAWHPFPCGGACIPYGTETYAIGKDWAEFAAQNGPCSDGIHSGCGPIVDSFYNLITHKLITPSYQHRDVVANLNTPRLLHRVCTPVRAPAGDTITPDGDFAVIADSHNVHTVLERCGSRLHLPIGQRGVGVVAMNSHAVVWTLPSSPANYNRYAGLFLPSLRRFDFDLPARVKHPSSQLTLDNDRIYFSDQRGRLWAAPFPST